MAIIQSILVGKGKGKIGNVVLSGLKGQTVAKQLNSSPSNPRTVAQTVNRVQMANAVLAWQFLSLFFASAKGLRKPLESTYNAFVRTVKGSMRSVLDASRKIAGVWVLEQNLFPGNWFNINLESNGNDKITLSLLNSGVQWLPSYHVCVLTVDNASESQNVIDVPVSESDFNSGVITVNISGMHPTNTVGAYVYDSASSKITNISSVIP